MKASVDFLRDLVTADASTFAATPAHDFAALFEQARLAQRELQRSLPLARRARLLRRLADLMVEHCDVLCAIVRSETGKPSCEVVLHELFGTIQLARFAAARGPKILQQKRLRPWLFWHRQSTIAWIPRGIVGIISPWNFPFALPMGDAIFAVCAGNAVLLKPSEHSPKTALAISWLFEAAGFAPELVTVALGAAAQGEALVAGDVDMVRFTGSVPVGKKIAALCASRLVPTVLELGGKDAALVLDDAELEAAADTVVYGAFVNAGQVCASVERVYVPEPLFERFVALVVAKTQALRVVDSRQAQEPFDIGPMITGAQTRHVEAQLNEARTRGAQIRCGGWRQGDALVPTVLTGVDESFSVCREETFGPVLPIMAVSSVEEGIKRANASCFGLTAYVLGSDLDVAKDVAKKLEAGTVMINDVLSTHAAPEAPWGGIKQSGLGHTHSAEGLRSYCEMRHINAPRLRGLSGVSPFGFPYATDTAASVVALLEAQRTDRGLLWRLLAATRAARHLLGLMRRRRKRAKPAARCS